MPVTPERISSPQPLGEVRLGPASGTTWLFQNGVVGPTRVIIADDGFSQVTLSPKAPVYFLHDTSGGPFTVGHCLALQKGVNGDVLSVVFKANTNADGLPEKLWSLLRREQDWLFAVPNFTAAVLSCVRCGQSFIKDRQPCECSKNAPTLLAAKISINFLTIYFGRNYHSVETSDARRKLLDEHVGGAVRALIFTEDL